MIKRLIKRHSAVALTVVALFGALAACETNVDEPVPIDAATGVDSALGHDSGAPADASLPDTNQPDTSPSCAYPTNCPMTRDFGTLSGDTSPSGGNTLSTTGDTSEWLSLRATENDSSIIGRAMTLSATLTSAPGTVYYLYLYINDGSAKAECTVVAGESTDSSGKQTSTISWGETTGGLGNGKDDSATVTVRVQRIGGACDSRDAWKLGVSGNVL